MPVYIPNSYLEFTYFYSKYELGIYTGTSCLIVKLPDEVCASHTKGVGEIKKLYNYSSQSAAH